MYALGMVREKYESTKRTGKEHLDGRSGTRTMNTCLMARGPRKRGKHLATVHAHDLVVAVIHKVHEHVAVWAIVA